MKCGFCGGQQAESSFAMGGWRSLGPAIPGNNMRFGGMGEGKTLWSLAFPTFNPSQDQ